MPTTTQLLTFELPTAITPTVAGLTVGAVVGVLGFIAVLLLVGRGSRRPSRRAAMAADQVVFIPPYAPYGSMQRETPLPPQAFATPGRPPGSFGPQGSYGSPGSYGPPAAFVAPSFVPSTELSARVFAKMGYALENDYEDAPAAEPQPFVQVDMLDDSDLIASNTPVLGSAPAVIVSPVVVLTPSGGVPSADKSAPHPLGIIKSTSSAMRAAPIADLSFDDSPTEIGEPYFDEPPQPRRRTDPPKIRAVAPAGPRFPEQTPLLPQVTPPPARATNSPRP